MCACICTYTHIYIYTHTHTHTHTHINIHIYIYTYTHTHKHIYIYIYTHFFLYKHSVFWVQPRYAYEFWYFSLKYAYNMLNYISILFSFFLYSVTFSLYPLYKASLRKILFYNAMISNSKTFFYVFIFLINFCFLES